MISFFIIAYVMAAIMVESSPTSPTVPTVVKDPAAKLDKIKKSSKLMKIRNFSKNNCAKQMKEHIKAISVLWLQADDVMEKKEDKKCDNQGGSVEIENVGEDLDDDFGMKIRENFLAEQTRPMFLK